MQLDCIEIDYRDTLRRPLRDAVAIAAVRLADSCLCKLDYKGYWRTCATIGGMFDTDEIATVRLGDFTFSFPASSPYWLRLVGERFRYEPGLERVLGNLKDAKYLFIDCGANYGYWSARVSGCEFGCQKAIAIEADPANFRMLQRNAASNGGRFRALNNALWRSGGEVLSLYGSGKNPTDYSLLQSSVADRPCATVTTLALDDLELTQVEQGLPTIVKLDVEGVEDEVFAGGRRLLAGDCLLLYEDHGADDRCRSTSWLLRNGNHSIWYCSSGGLVPVRDLEVVARIKKSRQIGYNFAAMTTDSPWLARFGGSAGPVRGAK